MQTESNQTQVRRQINPPLHYQPALLEVFHQGTQLAWPKLKLCGSVLPKPLDIELELELNFDFKATAKTRWYDS